MATSFIFLSVRRPHPMFASPYTAQSSPASRKLTASLLPGSCIPSNLCYTNFENFLADKKKIGWQMVFFYVVLFVFFNELTIKGSSMRKKKRNVKT